MLFVPGVFFLVWGHGCHGPHNDPRKVAFSCAAGFDMPPSGGGASSSLSIDKNPSPKSASQNNSVDLNQALLLLRARGRAVYRGAEKGAAGPPPKEEGTRTLKGYVRQPGVSKPGYCRFIRGPPNSIQNADSALPKAKLRSTSFPTTRGDLIAPTATQLQQENGNSPRSPLP